MSPFFDQPLERVENAMSGTVNGLLSFAVRDEFGEPVGGAVELLLTENATSPARQYRVTAKPGAPTIGGAFPSGSYTAQIAAPGFEVAREAIELGAGYALRRGLRLKRRNHRRPDLAERLAVYGLAADRLSALRIRTGERLVLDHRCYPEPGHFTVLAPGSVRDLKAWTGAPDAGFAGDTPRFGPAPRGPQSDLDAVFREYVHGNSRAVRAFEPALDAQLKSDPARFAVPLFHFTQVEIEDGGVLEIGAGSRVFFCASLTMHPQGVVRATGDIRADIGTCIQL